MRLVDVDKLERDLSELYEEQGWLPTDVHFSLRDVVANNWGRTVEAIPVEWIEKWIETDRNTKRRTPYYYKRLFRSRLKMMLEDWRKENEAN